MILTSAALKLDKSKGDVPKIFFVFKKRDQRFSTTAGVPAYTEGIRYIGGPSPSGQSLVGNSIDVVFASKQNGDERRLETTGRRTNRQPQRYYTRVLEDEMWVDYLVGTGMEELL